MAEHNEGMQMNGGTFNLTGSLSIGRNSRAVSQITIDKLEQQGKDDIAARLLDVEQAVAAHEDQLQDSEKVLEAIATISEELTTQKPNRITISGILNAISDSVRTVSQVATAVDSLRRALSHIL